MLKSTSDEFFAQLVKVYILELLVSGNFAGCKSEWPCFRLCNKYVHCVSKKHPQHFWL